MRQHKKGITLMRDLKPESPPLKPESSNLSSNSLHVDQNLPLPDIPTKNEGTDSQKVPTSGPEELAVDLPQALTAREKKLEKKLAETYAGLGFLLTRVNVYDGLVVIKSSEARATEMVLVARHHKWLLDALEKLMQSNDYITLAVGHGFMLYAILANHGRIKADESTLMQFGYHPSQLFPPAPQEEQPRAKSRKRTIKKPVPQPAPV